MKREGLKSLISEKQNNQNVILNRNGIRTGTEKGKKKLLRKSAKTPTVFPLLLIFIKSSFYSSSFFHFRTDTHALEQIEYLYCKYLIYS